MLPPYTRARLDLGFGKATGLFGPSCPLSLARSTDVLSSRMIHMIEDLAADWRRLDVRIERLTDEIEKLSLKDCGAKRLRSVPGFGPLISTAVVAAIGSDDGFFGSNLLLSNRSNKTLPQRVVT